jgi:hypothetical protein
VGRRTSRVTDGMPANVRSVMGFSLRLFIKKKKSVQFIFIFIFYFFEKQAGVRQTHVTDRDSILDLQLVTGLRLPHGNALNGKVFVSYMKDI